MILPMAAKQSNVGETMGKYRLILKAKYEDQELQAYMRYFKQRGEVLDIMRNVSSHLGDDLHQLDEEQRAVRDGAQSLVKAFQNYKLIASEHLPKDTEEGTFVQNFLQIALSSWSEDGRMYPYQNAPLIQESQHKHYRGVKSQKALMTQVEKTETDEAFLAKFGVTIDQAKLIRSITNKTFLKDSQLTQEAIEAVLKVKQDAPQPPLVSALDPELLKHKDEVQGYLNEKLKQLEAELSAPP